MASISGSDWAIIYILTTSIVGTLFIIHTLVEYVSKLVGKRK